MGAPGWALCRGRVGGGLRRLGNHVVWGPGALREARVKARGGGTHAGQLPSCLGAAWLVLSSGLGPQTSCPAAASRQARGEGQRGGGGGG